MQDPLLDPATSLLPAQFTLSTFAVWLIDFLKRSERFPWIDQNTQKLNTLVAVIAAALTAAGIHFLVEVGNDAGSYTIHITGLTVAGMLHFGKQFALAIASQQSILKVYQIAGALQFLAKQAMQVPPVTAAPASPERPLEA